MPQIQKQIHVFANIQQSHEENVNYFQKLNKMSKYFRLICHQNKLNEFNPGSVCSLDSVVGNICDFAHF